MTTATIASEASVGYRLDQANVVGEWLRIAPETGVAAAETASVRVRSVDRGASRTGDVPRKVLRRLRGFVIEMGGVEAKVGFVDDGGTYEYYLPAASLSKAGIKGENQPFQMDEVEVKTEAGVIVGYEFQPLAKPSDAFRDSFELDEERRQKRDLIFRTFRHAQA